MKTKTADEVIELIVETLELSDRELIEDIANKILSEKVEYIGDSLFEVSDRTTA